jgi:flagellar biosynthesis protein FliR
VFDALQLARLDDLIPFALVLARIAGIFAAIPIFGSGMVPTRIKTPLIFAMALLIFPIVRPHAIPPTDDALSLMLLTVREALIGITLGILSKCIFAAVEFCGHQVGTQIGLSMASMFDPNTQATVSTMAVFQGALATLVFLSLNAHHAFLQGIVESYQMIPIGAWHMSSGLLKFVVEMSSGIFIVAMKLAAPVAVALLATGVVLGIAARSFPAMNVFMVSMPLNIGVGLVILGLSLPVFVRVLQENFSALAQQMRVLFKLLA